MTLGTLFIARRLANLISGGIPHSGLPYPIRFIGIEKIDLTFIFGERVFLPVLVILILRFSFNCIFNFQFHSNSSFCYVV